MKAGLGIYTEAATVIWREIWIKGFIADDQLEFG